MYYFIASSYSINYNSMSFFNAFCYMSVLCGFTNIIKIHHQ